MQAPKQITARTYKLQQVGLSISTKNPRVGKFSPTWKGPFMIDKILIRGAFQLKDKDDEPQNMPINGQYPKRYIPSMWETTEKTPCREWMIFKKASIAEKIKMYKYH